MSSSLKRILLGVFVFLLLLSGFLYWQLLRTKNSNSGGIVGSISNTVSNSLNETKSAINLGPKVTVINNAKTYKINMPSESDIEKLAETSQVLSSTDSGISTIKITAEDSLASGNDYSLDNEVWIKTDSKVEGDTLNIQLALNTAVIKSIQGSDWNSQVSFVILTELYNQSPVYKTMLVKNRIDLIGKLISDKKNSDNKYYFTVSY